MSFNKRAIGLFLANLTQLVFSLLQITILAHFFALKNDFGKLQQISLVSAILVSTLTAIPNSMIYFWGKIQFDGDQTSAIIRRFVLLSLGISLCITLSLFGAHKLLFVFFKNDLFERFTVLISFLIGFRILNTLYPNVCILKGKIGLIILNNSLQIIFFLLSVTLGFIHGAQMLHNILWVFLIVEIIETLALFFVAFPYFIKKISFKVFTFQSSELRYVGYTLLNTVIITLTGQLDNLIVSKNTNPQTYSDYAILTFANPLTSIIVAAITTSMVPLISGYFAQGHYGKILDLWKKTAVKSIMVIMPVIVYTIQFGNSIVTVLFGNKFKNIAFLFQLYNCKYLFTFITLITVMNAIGFEKQIFINSLINLIVYAVCIYSGLNLAGLQGAVWGGIVAIYLGYLFPLYVLNNKLGWSVKQFFPFREFALTLSISGATGLVFSGCFSFFGMSNSGLTVVIFSPVFYLLNLFLYQRFVSPTSVLVKAGYNPPIKNEEQS